MWYVIMFSVLAILCVVVVLIRNGRVKAGEDTASPTSTDHPHTEQDRARRERKRRRAQSKTDRHKRH
jgi:hypothetical protein